MQIFIHRYVLKRKTLGTLQIESLQSKTLQNGALLKLTDENGNFGVADICPWPHLGDMTLEKELQLKGPLYQRAHQLALVDLSARKNEIQLNSGAAVKNHFLVYDYIKENLEKYQNKIIKIKCNDDIEKLSIFLNEKSKNFKSIRLDFNGCLSFEKYSKFISSLSIETKNKIECIEDPYDFNFEKWSESDVKIASDFILAKGWSNKIIKPSRTEINKDENFLYLTSAMDHPIGVAHGLICAQKYSNRIHGFLTLDMYEPTDFHSYFLQTKNEISYIAEGYGIGFETELSKIDWEPVVDWTSSETNQFFFSDKLTKEQAHELSELGNNFNKNGYFLIASSGSSLNENESLKLYAIQKKNFLNSAKRINNEFNLNKDMNWGCLLPTYHVGGLSILARSYLMNSKVYFSNWKKFSADWIIENNIQLLSLVPTQIYDLVVNKIKGPEVLKYVFVGGAHLSDELEKQARDLGWPLIVTFGMTETSSMIAYRVAGNEYYKPFGGIKISATNHSKLKIECDSLADYSLQKVNNKIVIKELCAKGSYEAEDIIQLAENEFKFLNKENDKIKINSETISLFYLRQKLENILLQACLSGIDMAIVAIPDLRSGEKLVLVVGLKAHQAAVDIQSEFNLRVQSYEKIKSIYFLESEIPITELNKIKYLELKNKILNENQDIK